MILYISSRKKRSKNNLYKEAIDSSEEKECVRSKKMNKESFEYHVSMPLRGSIFYRGGHQALISALESMYGSGEVPLPSPLLARQRALSRSDDPFWNCRFHASPQVQIEVDSEKVVIFDHRVVDPMHLDDSPLLNPRYLRDHWDETKGGALPVPSVYADSLVDLSQTAGSGVVAVSHKDLGAMNEHIHFNQAAQHPYFIAFTSLSEADRALYLKAHEAKHGKQMGLWCVLEDAEKEVPMGCLSVFGNNYDLYGDDIHSDLARLAGVQRALVISSAQGATINIEDLGGELRTKFPDIDAAKLGEILSRYR